MTIQKDPIINIRVEPHNTIGDYRYLARKQKIKETVNKVDFYKNKINEYSKIFAEDPNINKYNRPVFKFTIEIISHSCFSPQNLLLDSLFYKSYGIRFFGPVTYKLYPLNNARNFKFPLNYLFLIKKGDIPQEFENIPVWKTESLINFRKFSWKFLELHNNDSIFNSPEERLAIEKKSKNVIKSLEILEDEKFSIWRFLKLATNSKDFENVKLFHLARQVAELYIYNEGLMNNYPYTNYLKANRFHPVSKISLAISAASFIAYIFEKYIHTKIMEKGLTAIPENADTYKEMSTLKNIIFEMEDSFASKLLNFSSKIFSFNNLIFAPISFAIFQIRPMILGYYYQSKHRFAVKECDLAAANISEKIRQGGSDLVRVNRTMPTSKIVRYMHGQPAFTSRIRYLSPRVSEL